MGGTSKQQQTSSSQSQQAPYAPAQAGVQSLIDLTSGQLGNTGLTGNEQGALSGLTGNAAAGNPYSGQIGSLATDLLNGGTDRTGMVQGAYDQLRGSLQPYTNLDTNPYSNPAFAKATGYMSDDITNRIKSQYAGAGYSPVSSGDFAKTLGEGISRGIAPTWLQANNDLENRKLGAISGLYSAGGQTAGLLSGLDQTALGNRATGIGAADAALTARDQPYQAMLAAEAQRRGIPLQNISQLESLIVPMAQLGGTTNTTGQAQGSYTMSPLQQAMGWQSLLTGKNPFSFNLGFGGK